MSTTMPMRIPTLVMEEQRRRTRLLRQLLHPSQSQKSQIYKMCIVSPFQAAAPKPKPQPNPSPRSEYQDYDDEPEYTEYETDVLYNEYVYDNEVDPTASVHDGFVPEEDSHSEGEEGGSGDSGDGFACPGGDLQTCVDVCPGQFGAKVYGACVLSCGRRCP